MPGSTLLPAWRAFAALQAYSMPVDAGRLVPICHGAGSAVCHVILVWCSGKVFAGCAHALCMLCRPGTGGSKAGQVSISLGNTTVPPGARAKMQLTYTGQLSPNSGIYRSEAFSVEGAGEARESVLLVSQLEQRGARHVFPCVDEPHVKARPHSDIHQDCCRQQCILPPSWQGLQEILVWYSCRGFSAGNDTLAPLR